MAEPTLQQVWGPNSSQTAEHLIISKTDLATTGLTVANVNKSEPLLVAVFLLAKQYLTEANFDANPEQNISIEDGFASLVTRNSQSYRRQTFSFNLHKLDTGATIDPDDY